MGIIKGIGNCLRSLVSRQGQQPGQGQRIQDNPVPMRVHAVALAIIATTACIDLPTAGIFGLSYLVMLYTAGSFQNPALDEAPHRQAIVQRPEAGLAAEEDQQQAGQAAIAENDDDLARAVQLSLQLQQPIAVRRAREDHQRELVHRDPEVPGNQRFHEKYPVLAVPANVARMPREGREAQEALRIESARGGKAAAQHPQRDAVSSGKEALARLLIDNDVKDLDEDLPLVQSVLISMAGRDLRDSLERATCIAAFLAQDYPLLSQSVANRLKEKKYIELAEIVESILNKLPEDKIMYSKIPRKYFIHLNPADPEDTYDVRVLIKCFISSNKLLRPYERTPLDDDQLLRIEEAVTLRPGSLREVIGYRLPQEISANVENQLSEAAIHQGRLRNDDDSVQEMTDHVETQKRELRNELMKEALIQAIQDPKMRRALQKFLISE